MFSLEKAKKRISFSLQKKIIVNIMFHQKGLLPIAVHYEQNWEMTPRFQKVNDFYPISVYIFSK